MALCSRRANSDIKERQKASFLFFICQCPSPFLLWQFSWIKVLSGGNLGKFLGKQIICCTQCKHTIMRVICPPTVKELANIMALYIENDTVERGISWWMCR